MTEPDHENNRKLLAFDNNNDKDAENFERKRDPGRGGTSIKIVTTFVDINETQRFPSTNEEYSGVTRGINTKFPKIEYQIRMGITSQKLNIMLETLCSPHNHSLLSSMHLTGNANIDSQWSVLMLSCRSVVCEYCWSSMVGGGLTWCQECGLVRYCGEVCRMKGWEEHRMECSFIGQHGAGGRVLSDNLRLLVRIWLNIKTGRGMDPEICGDLEKSWASLEDHIEDIKNDKEHLLRCQYHLLGAVMNKEDMPDYDTFVSIYCKILINGIPLTSDRLDDIVVSLEMACENNFFPETFLSTQNRLVLEFISSPRCLTIPVSPMSASGSQEEI